MKKQNTQTVWNEKFNQHRLNLVFTVPASVLKFLQNIDVLNISKSKIKLKKENKKYVLSVKAVEFPGQSHRMLKHAAPRMFINNRRISEVFDLSREAEVEIEHLIFDVLNESRPEPKLTSRCYI